MRTLRLVTLWPMLFVAFFIALLLSCKKDRFDALQASASINLPISVSEAKTYFEKLNLNSQSSFEGDSTRMLNIDVEPLWGEAFLSYSASGRAIVIAPLADTSISTLNDGRAGVKLIFSRLGADTISVEAIMYIADSAYYESVNHEINFSTFTGFFVLFDIGLHFKNGVNVVNGTPVGRVKNIYKGDFQPSPDERDDGNCFTVFEVVYEPCPYTFSECEEPVVVEGQDCVHEIGGIVHEQLLPGFVLDGLICLSNTKMLAQVLEKRSLCAAFKPVLPLKKGVHFAPEKVFVFVLIWVFTFTGF